MDLPHVASCELEWRRQRTFFFHNENRKDTDDKDIVPVVELKPFSRKVWRKSRSLPIVDSIGPFAEPKSGNESPRSPTNDRYSEDPRQIYRDTMYLLTELENQKLSSIYANHYQSSVSGDSRKLPRVPNSRGFPIKPVGFASVKDRASVTFDDIKLGKRGQSIDPAMYIRGENFSDAPYATGTDRRMPRSKSVPNNFYSFGSSVSRGRKWPLQKGPILINNSPLSTEKRAWYGNESPAPLVPEFNDLEFDEIQNEYTKLVRRIRLARFVNQQDSIITKTFGAPTRGEISIRLGMYQNLSREKIREMKIREMKKRNQQKPSTMKEEPEQDETANAQAESSDQPRSSYNEGSPMEDPSIGRKSKMSKSVTFEDETELRTDLEGEDDDVAEVKDLASGSRRLLVDLPNQEDDHDSSQIQSDTNVEANEDNVLIQVQEADQEVAKITGTEDDEEVEDCDGKRLGQKIFMTTSSRQGTPGVMTPRLDTETPLSHTNDVEETKPAANENEEHQQTQEYSVRDSHMNEDMDDDDSSVSSGEEMLELQNVLPNEDSTINQDKSSEPIKPEPSEPNV